VPFKHGNYNKDKNKKVRLEGEKVHDTQEDEILDAQNRRRLDE